MATPASTRLPQDTALAGMVGRARAELLEIDPLGALLRGEATGGLPLAGADAHERDRATLVALAGALEGLTVPIGADEIDRLALLYGLRRATPPPGPWPPTGSVLLERHLLAQLTRVLFDLEAEADRLTELIESAPGFLAEARQGPLGGPAAGGEVALAAAKRLPALLDVIASMAATLPAATRERIEAGLGILLAAAAEDGGWIVRDYMAAAAPPEARSDLVESAIELGLGAGLEELQTSAEEVLAEQAATAFEEPAAPPAPSAEAEWPLGEVGARIAAAAENRWCASPPGSVWSMVAAPAWMQPLLPPLVLVDPGGLSDRDPLVLAAPGVPYAEADLEGATQALYLGEMLPALWQRQATPLARLLLPASDVVSAYQVTTRALAPGLATWRPSDARRELAWRAMLALVGAGFARGRLGLEEAAALIAAETGMDEETARMQAAHVAAQPLAALAFIAGMRRVDQLWVGREADPDPAATRARLLAAGPIPAGVLEMVPGYTR
ncbi:MAG: hypothetical protein WBD38_11025 [Candidatus Dormiibacterota bacterium]